METFSTIQKQLPTMPIEYARKVQRMAEFGERQAAMRYRYTRNQADLAVADDALLTWCLATARILHGSNPESTQNHAV